MINLIEYLNDLDHGTIADIVGDVRVLELTEMVLKSRNSELHRGEIILDSAGGAASILGDQLRRNKLFLSLPKDKQESVRLKLGVENLFQFRLTPDIKQVLYGEFGFQAPPSDKNEIKPAVSANPVRYGLFAHQTDVLLRCQKYLSQREGRVLLHMPTGSGKTRTAMHLISRHLNSRPSGVVVWLVAGIELCEQSAREFERAWENLGERPLPVIRLWSRASGVDHESFKRAALDGRAIDMGIFKEDSWPSKLPDAFIVGSVDSVSRIIDKWEPGERVQKLSNVSLIVFDEAHRASAQSYSRVVDTLAGNRSLLGLSATPGRHHYGESTDPDHLIVNMFGSNKVTLNIPGYESPIDALTDMGYLSRLNRELLEIADSNMPQHVIDDIRKRRSSSFDVNTKQLEAFGLDAVRNLQIVARVERLALDEGHRRVLVFAPSVAASNLLANLLRGRGLRARSLSALTPPAERGAALKDFASKEAQPRVLCNYGVLTMGYDEPQISAVVIARPSNSIVLLNQMAGRALRGPKVGGNANAKLITVVDTKIPELVNAAKQFHAFDDSWQDKTFKK